MGSFKAAGKLGHQTLPFYPPTNKGDIAISLMSVRP